MATVTHATPADSTFTSEGAAAWNAGHTVDLGANLDYVAANMTSADAAGLIAAAGLESSTWTWDVNVAGTANIAISAAVNTFYVRSIAGYTADRTLTLPATAAVGDRVGIAIATGDDAYELLITASSGDTLNGVAGGTEWSRLFISGEVVIMRCIVANSTWIVEYDGRIPQRGVIRLSTAASAESAATFVRPTSQSGVFTAEKDNASITTVGSSQIKTRRAGDFTVHISGQPASQMGNDKYYTVAAVKNATTFTNVITVSQQISSPANANALQPQCTNLANSVSLVVDDYITFLYRSEEGSKGCAAFASPRVTTSMSLVEILP